MTNASQPKQMRSQFSPPLNGTKGEEGAAKPSGSQDIGHLEAEIRRLQQKNRELEDSLRTVEQDALPQSIMKWIPKVQAALTQLECVMKYNAFEGGEEFCEEQLEDMKLALQTMRDCEDKATAIINSWTM